MEHPDGKQHALVGFDDAVGWYASLWHEDRLTDEYDGMVSNRPATVRGILGFLVRHGFFEAEHVHDAFHLVPHIDDPGDLDDHPGGVIRAAQVIVAVREIGAT